MDYPKTETNEMCKTIAASIIDKRYPWINDFEPMAAQNGISKEDVKHFLLDISDIDKLFSLMAQPMETTLVELEEFKTKEILSV